MADRPRFLTASRALRLDPADLDARAAWLGLTALHTRPLPTDEACLVLTRMGVRLQVPGGGAGLWPAGLVDWRSARGDTDALVRALDLRPGERVLDGTLGLGHDALLLARRGVRVLCLEHDPALLYYSAQGLLRYDPAAARHLAFCCTDHRAFLPRQPTGAFDAVYLDPMFPPGRHRRSPTLEPLRRCALPDAVTPATLRDAWRVAARVLVLRLPPDGEVPSVEGLPEGLRIESRRVAFAAWRRPPGGPALDPLLAVPADVC
jgi:SAM-dependent methyltransferase